MSKIILNENDFIQVMNHNLKGQSQKKLAENLDISPDTVTRILKEYPEYKNGGNFTKTKDGFVITDKKSILYSTSNNYPPVANGINITGNPDDGILVVSESQAKKLKEAVSLVLDNPKNSKKSENSITIGVVASIDDKTESVALTKWNQSHYIIKEDGVNPPSPTFKMSLSEPKANVEPKKEEIVDESVDDQVEYIWSANSKSVTISKGLKSNTVDSSNTHFKKILKLVMDGKFEKALELMNIKKALKNFSSGKLKIEGNKCYYEDIEVSGEVIQRIITSHRNGEKFEKYVNFYIKLKSNPDTSVIDRLYAFLKANEIEILENGNFSAYKVITSAYKDCRTGTIDNSIGTTVTMQRSDVDKDHRNTCSHGLHVCSKSYISSFRSGGDIVVITEVSPEDVVSVPYDYNGAKMRVCKYKVVKLHSE